MTINFFRIPIMLNANKLSLPIWNLKVPGRLREISLDLNRLLNFALRTQKFRRDSDLITAIVLIGRQI